MYSQYKEDKGRKPRNIANGIMTYFINELFIKEGKNQMLAYINRIEDKDVKENLKGMTLLGVFTDTHEFTGERKVKEKHNFDNGQPDETKD